MRSGNISVENSDGPAPGFLSKLGKTLSVMGVVLLPFLPIVPTAGASIFVFTHLVEGGAHAITAAQAIFTVLAGATSSVAMQLGFKAMNTKKLQKQQAAAIQARAMQMEQPQPALQQSVGVTQEQIPSLPRNVELSPSQTPEYPAVSGGGYAVCGTGRGGRNP